MSPLNICPIPSDIIPFNDSKSSGFLPSSFIGELKTATILDPFGRSLLRSAYLEADLNSIFLTESKILDFKLIFPPLEGTCGIAPIFILALMSLMIFIGEGISAIKFFDCLGNCTSGTVIALFK